MLTKLDIGRVGSHTDVRIKLLVGRHEIQEKFETTLQTTKLREISFGYKVR